MKHLFQLGFIAILFFFYSESYAQQVTNAKSKQKAIKVKNAGMDKERISDSEQGAISMQGAYAMYNQVMNDGTKDSVMGIEQLKIFTDRHMMYAHKNSGDSFATYGIGTYKVQNGKVVEHVFYTSGGGAGNDTFELDINLVNDGFTQIINFPGEQGRNFKLTEDYKSVGKNVASPLDGAWKQTRAVYTSKEGSITSNNNPTQFKVFQSGHFMWASTAQDSATKKPLSYFGYGTFGMTDDNKVKEENTNSTFAAALVGTPVTLDVKFTGKDVFQQSISWPDGSKSIEYYERLK
jgi:hypothetical protein